MAKDSDFISAARKIAADTNNRNDVGWTVRGARRRLGALEKYSAANGTTRAAMHDALDDDTKSLISEFGLDGAIRRMRRALELDDMRPRDLSIYQFVRSDDLFDVAGAFSTFDAKITKMQKKGASPKKLREYLSGALRNKTEVALEYIRALKDFVEKNNALYKEARANTTHGDRASLARFLQKLADAMRGDFGLDAVPLDVVVLDSWARAPDFLRRVIKDSEGKQLYGLLAEMPRPDGTMGYAVFINRATRVRHCTDANLGDAFNMICGTFMHEFGHFVDKVLPNYGMVGAQKIAAGEKIPANANKDYEEYKHNPTEESSMFIAAAVRGHLKKHMH